MRKRAALAPAAVAVAVVILLNGPTMVAAEPVDVRAATVSGKWMLVSNPSQTYLKDVTAKSSNDAWAVGINNVERWNGSAWAVSLYKDPVFFEGVDETGPSDVWAVGWFNSNAYSYHWDGSTWTSIPTGGGGIGSLSGVAAVSAKSVWAVGAQGLVTLTEHWDGTTWSVVSSPNPASGSPYLNAISAISDSDLWAVGSTLDGSLWHPLIEHWNGTAWSIVPTPSTGFEQYLDDVTAVSASDVWTVGWSRSGQEFRPLAMHWNGTRWMTSRLPKLPAGATLQGVAASSSSDVWAVGAMSSKIGYPMTLTLHWDGLAWSRVPSPNQGGTYGVNYLNAVTVLPGGESWAVGEENGLILRYFAVS